MTDVKRLLDEATPLPWEMSKRMSYRGAKRIVQYGWVVSGGRLLVGRGYAASPDADARLIVHAVNRLPDYEAAVDALERVRGEMYLPAHQHEQADESCVGCDLLQRLNGTTLPASESLRRLRDEVSA